MNLKKILLLINVCLTALVIWMGANIVLGWAPKTTDSNQIPSDTKKPADPIKKADGKPKSLKYYQDIIQNDIFKTSKETPNNAAKEIKVVKLTDLNLKLKGTVVGDRSNSFAIIWDGSTNKEELYHVDDLVQNAKIVNILSDRVILNLKGVEEALIIVEDSAHPVKGPPQRPGRPPIRKRTVKRPVPPPNK